MIPSAAAAAAADIETVGRRALVEVRDAVSGYRRADLRTEAARAEHALTDAGITTTLRVTTVGARSAVGRDPGVGRARGRDERVAAQRRRPLHDHGDSTGTNGSTLVIADDGRGAGTPSMRTNRVSTPTGNGLRGVAGAGGSAASGFTRRIAA